MNRALGLAVAIGVFGCSSSPPDTEPNVSNDNHGGGGKADGVVMTSPIGADPSGGPTMYPIVLCHGWKASANHWGFYLVADALREDGHQVYEGSVPPFQSAEVRAQALAQIVDQALSESGAGKVNLIAHSMGGLDARALISTLGYGDRVATLTTMSTPHRGSAVADALLDILDGLNVDDNFANAFAQAFGQTISSVADDPDFRASVLDISERNADTFNANHPDDPQVVYQSVAGVSSVMGLPNGRDIEDCDFSYFNHADGSPAYPGSAGGADVMSPLLVPLAHFTSHQSFDPNDGLVAVTSGKWGNFLGCVPADHLDEVGADSHTAPDPKTGFDHRRFFRNIAFDLAARGF